MGCNCGPWITCTGKVYDEKWEECAKCGHRQLKGLRDDEDEESCDDAIYDPNYVEQLEGIANEMRSSIENMISIIDLGREPLCGKLGALNQAKLILDQYHTLMSAYSGD